jgi:hypothetical protein
MSSQPRVVARVIAVVLAGAVVGCGADANTDADARSDVRDTAALALEVSLAQSRSDVVANRLAVVVTNGGANPLTVTAMSVSAPQFTEDAVRPARKSILAPGVPVALAVALPPADCTQAPSVATVTLTISQQGQNHIWTAVASDPSQVMARLHDRTCFRQRAAEQIVVRLSDQMNVVEVAGRPAAQLTMEITYREGVSRAIAVRGTTLLTHVDPVTGKQLTSLAIEGRPPRVLVHLVPSRCDLHAIAEDKRGTVLPVSVEVTGSDDEVLWGVIDVAARDSLADQLRAFVVDACARGR